MFAGGAVIFIAVLALTAVAATRPASLPQWLRGHALILGAGLAFPIVLLTVLLAYGLYLTGKGNTGMLSGLPEIEVTGHQFWWRVRYLKPSGETDFETANELRLAVGRPARLLLKSADVIHSFWVPSLAGKIDMLPGRVTILHLSAEREGVYRGQCAEFCGLQHANMALNVLAMPEDAFAGWQMQQRRQAIVPEESELVHGREVFAANGCGVCHTVRGTGATGLLGPDLTHMGSRYSVGAGMLPRNAGTLAGWIAGGQHIKPGNPMPSYDRLPSTDLRALAYYLDSLK